MTRQPIIQLQNVTHRYDEKIVLSDVNLTINKGDFVVITGRNGGGKTTLLRLLLRLIKPSEGTVKHFPNGNEKDINFGYLPQKNMIDSKFPITVNDVVKMGLNLSPRHRAGEQELQQLDDIIAEMGLTELRNNAIGQLSGGQLQRALLARAVISKPDVLVMDEPLSYLDRQFEQQLYQLLEQWRQSMTVILVSHDISGINAPTNRHIKVDRNIQEEQPE